MRIGLLTHPEQPGIEMTRAAGIFLLLAVTFDIFDGNQYLIHGHAEEIPERVEVIYSRRLSPFCHL